MKFQNKEFQFTVERQVDGTFSIFTKRLIDSKFLGCTLAPAGTVGRLEISEYDTQLERLETQNNFSVDQVLAILASKRALPVFGVELTPEKIKNKLENLNVKKFSESYDY